MKNLRLLATLLVVSTSVRAQTPIGQTPAAQTPVAQTGPGGSWAVEGTGPGFPWTAELKADGQKLTGTITSCASNAGEIMIYDGRIDGNVVTFKCKSLNGVRTVTLTGTINGDEIAFTWTKEPLGNAFDNAIFGDSAPRQFKATRLDEAALKRLSVSRWTGTAQNINGQGVVNSNRSQVLMEVKQVPDPHWRWRDVGELTVVNFIVGGNGGGTYETNSFTPGDKELSFTFSRTTDDEPGRDDSVQCVLPRRADGAYEGDCKGGGFRRHLTLTPPAAPAPAAAK